MHRHPISIGTWLSLGSPAAAEIAALCGYDWVLLDLEHGCETDAALPHQLRALRGGTTRAIVRVGAPHPDLIGRVLDWGADGIMVPRVETAAEAVAIVEATRHSPRGRRGYARTVRSMGYGLKVESATDSVVLAQIETVAAVAEAAAIAAVDGIDALFVGPADLGFDLAARHDSRTVADCLPGIVAATQSSEKAAGILVRTPEDLAHMRDLGFSWLAIDSDISLLREGMRRHLEAGRALS
ncbi:MAG: hypothetical protein JNK37_22280 [Verrucomicrobiales bacterium]|nr:hypothetical protein [Verrucomicrobiales bacterium]